jgi:ABC-type sugar transport system ATPase subunit
VNAAPLLELRGIHRSFPGVHALRGVDLQVQAGRVLLLLGANGAGKSTLMNVLSGVLAPDAGDLLLDGQRVRFESVRAANRAGIAAVFQELSLAPNLTVAEAIFLGREPRLRSGLLDRASMRAQTQTLLARLRAQISPDAIVSTQRVGLQQVVEIARALSVGARILILDEPTSALSRKETKVLLQLVLELKQAGVAIIYITHKFEELGAIGDDVAIMRDGKLVACALFSNLTSEQIVRLLAGGTAPATSASLAAATPGPKVLRVRDATLKDATRPGRYRLQAVDFELHRGEILGIFGLMGAGRTELLEVILGLHGRRGHADVEVEGSAVRLDSPGRARELGIMLAPADRKRDGLVLDMSATENAGLACQAQTAQLGFLRRRRERAQLEPIFQRLRVRSDSLDRPVYTLSGGNQQKVILAKWLSAAPRVLLLDEPTRGIDVNTRQEIYKLMREMAAQGLGIVLVSSDMDEILALSDRVIVLCEGRKTLQLGRAGLTPERLMAAAVPKTSEGMQ